MPINDEAGKGESRPEDDLPVPLANDEKQQKRAYSSPKSGDPKAAAILNLPN